MSKAASVQPAARADSPPPGNRHDELGPGTGLKGRALQQPSVTTRTSHRIHAALASHRALCTGKKERSPPTTHPRLGAGPPTDAAGPAAAKALFCTRKPPEPPLLSEDRTPWTAHGSQTNPSPLSPPPLVALLVQPAAPVCTPGPVPIRSAGFKWPPPDWTSSFRRGWTCESEGIWGWALMDDLGDVGGRSLVACPLRLLRWAFRNGVQLGRAEACAEGFIAGSPSRACSVRSKALSSAGRPNRGRPPRAHNTGPDCAGPFCRPAGRRE